MNKGQETIPYEKQADPQTSRMCGAACLAMVYRSFGKETPQAEIWPAISKPNQFGNLASTTHLMAQDALTRGFSAVAIQARHPLQALRLCHESGIRAILNHRLQNDSATGHYTVMVDLDDKGVVLHDPSFGPSRRLSQAALLGLWQPHFSNSEIVGNVLIAIAADPPAVPACQFCHTPIPPSVECPRCKNLIGLRPGAVLGCMNQNCIARMWGYICCPACDFMWDSGSAQAGATGNPLMADAPAPDKGASGDATEPASLNQMFEALDKFVNHAKSVPGMADHAELQQQLQILTSSKAALKLALAEATVYGQVHQNRLAAFAQAAKERGEAHRKKVEELNSPSPPLDGNALGRALLKNLGFTA
jgi:Peptidase C39 family